MTEDTLTAAARRIDDTTTWTPTTDADTAAAREHPLATRTGVAVLTEILCADHVWRHCTTPQRALITELCAHLTPVIAQRKLTEADLPALPDIQSGMRAALERRRLIRDDRLTQTAVHAWYWAVGVRDEAEEVPA